MMLRQYKRIRAREKRDFSYGKIKKVYLIVLYENSPPELRHMPETCLHRSRHIFDTGLEMDLLQRCVLISLDIFRKNMQNKAINTLEEAWLTFLCEDNPERLVELFEAFPQFIAMYETLYNMNKDMVKAMGFFSEELRIMDQNTVRYMMDEMESRLACLQIEAEKLESQNSELENQNSRLENRKNELENQNSELENQNSVLEVHNTQLAAENNRLRTELQKYREKQL